MNTDLHIYETGVLDIFYKTAEGEEKPVLSCTNGAVATGANVLANALANQGGIKYLYVAYSNSGDIVWQGTSSSVTISDFTSLRGNCGCIKVPAYLLGGVNDNAVTIQGITETTTPVTSGMAQFGEASRVYSVGLVGEVNGKDVLFSVANIRHNNSNTYIQKIANAQIGINWTVTLNIG